MCENVTDVIRRACAEPFFGMALVDRIIRRIRERLQVDPQHSITFELDCGEVARSTLPISVRVAFLRQDWDHLLSILEMGDCGAWSEATLLYRGDLFHVCGNGADNEMLVVFW